jgi:hypothetical protein
MFICIVEEDEEDKHKSKQNYHCSVDWYSADEVPKHEASMSVFTTPGLRAMAANPGGNSFANERVKPSIAHFEAQ